MTEPLFFVMRHGQTAGNELNIYRGWSNDEFAQLDADGREGVRESAIFLKNVGYTFPLIITDDLDRTQESAKIAASILDIREIITVPELKPLNVGDFTGESKEEYPLHEYMNDHNKKIPGGESLGEFDVRMGEVFATVLDTVIKLKQPVLLILHGSSISFLNNHMSKDAKHVGYEGLVKPSGVLVFTEDGIIPCTKLRTPFHNNPYADGTALSGFVTDEENRPPRECWNCRYYQKDPNVYTGSCMNIIVRIDPQNQLRKQTDGTIAVGERDCCNSFRNKIST